MGIETEDDDTDRESVGRKLVEELPAAKLQEFTEIFSFFDRYFYFLKLIYFCVQKISNSKYQDSVKI